MGNDVPKEVMCPSCGKVLSPPNDFVGDLWTQDGCEKCRDRHNQRARALLAKAGLLTD